MSSRAILCHLTSPLLIYSHLTACHLFQVNFNDDVTCPIKGGIEFFADCPDYETECMATYIGADDKLSRQVIPSSFHHAIVPSQHRAIMASCHHAITSSRHHVITPSRHDVIMSSDDPPS